ncbi:MAG: hypothetical protein DDT25_00117 [Chloroflexi bacterium]|nr:hypothetical protein [Chloroflexota bacterium]
MTITNTDQLIDALANRSSRFVIDKASIINQNVGTFTSLWRVTGQPAQGAIPALTPAVPNHTTIGAIDFTQQIAPATSYIGWMFASSVNASTTLEIHDRVAHVAGLSLNVTTAQPITGMDLGPTGLNLEPARRGAANFSDIQWWLEIYIDGGTTASNATINVTYSDGTTGNLNLLGVGATRTARLSPLIPLIPLADQGKYIRGINSITLSALTGGAGNAGFTATRSRTAIPMSQANFTTVSDFSALSLPEIPNNSCLMLLLLPGATTSGILRGGGKIIHG